MSTLRQKVARTFISIKKHKFLFALVVLLQVIFVTALLYVVMTYQLQLLEDVQKITIPLQEATYDAEILKQGGSFVDDFAPIYRGFISLKQHLYEMAGWLSGIFLVLHGTLWVLSHYLVFRKNWKSLLKGWLRYVITLGAIFAPFFFVCSILLRKLLQQDIPIVDFSTALYVTLFVLLAISYVAMVFLAYISEKSWKRWLIHSLKSFKSIHQHLLLLLIIIILVLFGIALLYAAFTYGAFLPFILLAGLLFFTILAATRIFWIISLKDESYN